ncbi:TIGR01777 family protein [Aggregatimonas sangjinii]|uniref:TIGR01777 family protein n=1 Tax=Aggregatimonas sangjinii TaxID=2583587 RepID=A0A5B7SVS4_9FLAO|nr:TIGR01777 family oxidoreductase [Aggregatimonas sangjinii]QCX01118.1 TIGR01777 family protein [Aggregatimonas sangjinii]
MKKMIIAGGTGFLGNACIDYFKSSYDMIYVLTRGRLRQLDNVHYVNWDAKTLGDWCTHINDCDVLINMTGRSVDCRYTAKNKNSILNSRTNSTSVLGEALAKAKHPPRLWLNSSTATIYRHSLVAEMGEENGEIGNGFSVDVAKAWESAFFSVPIPNTRKVALRTSIVLGKGGGALRQIKNLAKIGFGGKQGSGNQKFSWIHLTDFLRAIRHLIENETLEGPVNLVAPKPVTNTALMKAVRKSVGMPFGIPLSKVLLEIGARIIGTETELVLKSRNVVPKKLVHSGFEFNYRSLDAALEEAI